MKLLKPTPIALLCSLLALPIVADRSSSAVAQQVETEVNPSLRGESAWYVRKSEWHGFDQFHFLVGDRKAYLVVPKSPLPRNPWIWRARFPNYHAEMDIELISQGFHLAYFDVAGQFGCPEIVENANAFYQFLVETRQLNPKPAMEGVSRGGLFVYNWTAAHPNLVA